MATLRLKRSWQSMWVDKINEDDDVRGLIQRKYKGKGAIRYLDVEKKSIFFSFIIDRLKSIIYYNNEAIF